MKKTVMVMSILSACASGAWAQQSSVTLYGIVDAGVRHTSDSVGTDNTVTPGGMSQSRLGINISEDLGGGLKALANAEHRFLSSTGSVAAADFWRQSWVGLQSSDFGRVTLGRQYNVLFDVLTSTYASFKYSPYIEVYKPEIGFSLGARNNNMVKYMVEVGGLRAEAQVSGNDATTGRSTGGLLRYAAGEFAVAGAYLNQKDVAGKNVKATTLGGAWTSGPWYANVGWARNKFDAGFNGTLNATLAGSIVGALNSAAALGEHRDMWTVGGTYQLTPELNLGAQYWNAKQVGTVAAGDGKGDFYAFVSDYAFSKRTDAYLELDHTKIGGHLTLANGSTKRTGYTLGLRHRF